MFCITLPVQYLNSTLFCITLPVQYLNSTLFTTLNAEGSYLTFPIAMCTGIYYTYLFFAFRLKYFTVHYCVICNDI